MLTYLGLSCVVISWLAGCYLLLRWRGTTAMSISLHAASARGAYLLFASVLTLGGGLFMVYLYTVFIPHLQLSPLFSGLLALAFLGQVITAWVPDIEAKGHWRSRIHKTAAWSMAVLFLPLATLIATAPTLTPLASIICWCCLAYMIGALSYWLWRRDQSRFLVFQAFYVIAFQISILAAGYL
jgi:hypothetical protein